MALYGSRERYGTVAQALHWLTAILVLVAFLVGEGGPESRVYAPERDAQRILHESLGLAVLAIVVLRLIWRLLDRAPDEPPMPGWMSRSAAATHWLLYLLLFAVPLTAILGAWWEGHPLDAYLIGSVAPMIAPAHDLGVAVSEIHTWLGDAILWVAGLHAVAAIGHHFVLRDRTLMQMLPFGK
ncbi:MAG TPA: cytochrome b [Candidatus Binatia bacterium]|nr:cytochrome b [Candidatus Binatia bacterium]